MTQTLEKKEATPTRLCEATRARTDVVPDTDIYESDEAIVFVADMPGVDDKHVELTLEDDELTFCGRVERPEPEGLGLLHDEGLAGGYRRAFTLSTPIDRERVSARMRNGVLTVVLPKAAEARPRRIEVKGG